MPGTALVRRARRIGIGKGRTGRFLADRLGAFAALRDASAPVSTDDMEAFASGVKLDLAAGGAECRAEVEDLVRASIACSDADRAAEDAGVEAERRSAARVEQRKVGGRLGRLEPGEQSAHSL